MDDALGMVEIKGLASAIAVADVMVKTANVRLIGAERARGHGWTTIKVMGDVGAVTAAVSAGKQKGEECNGFVSSKVIPRPVQGVKDMFCVPQGEREKKIEEQSPKKEEEKKKETKVASRTAKKAGTKQPAKTKAKRDEKKQEKQPVGKNTETAEPETKESAAVPDKKLTVEENKE